MMDEQRKKEVIHLYSLIFQKTINADRASHPQYAEIPDSAFVGIIDDELTGEIKRRNANFSPYKMCEAQREEYNKALCYQINYVLTQGDYYMMSGHDVVTNTMIPQADMAARRLSPIAEMLVCNAGLLYAGLGDGYIPPYRLRRGF